MLSQSRPAKINSFNYQLSAALKYITAEIWNTKGTQNNTCRRSWWRQWNDRKSCGETNFVQIFRSVHFKQRSEVSEAKNALSQRLQRKTSDFARKGELLSTNSDQIKTYNDCINILFVYDTFYDQKNLKKKCYPRPSTWYPWPLPTSSPGLFP